jgi:hypothetical protein
MLNWTKKIDVHSYEEYLKEVEKKMESKEDFYEGSYVSYQVKDVKTAKQLLKKVPTDDNIHSILEEFIKHYNDTAVDYGVRCGKLIGIEMTHEDYYYMLSDGKKQWYESCVGKLKYLDE